MSAHLRSLKGFLPSVTFVMAKKQKVHPALLFVGDPASFEGAGGELLNKMMEAMGQKRKSVSCVDFEKASEANLQSLEPKLIVVLGFQYASKLLQQPVSESLRGKIHEFQKIKLIATYHPGELLKNSALKKETWEDLKLAMKVLESSPHVR